MLLICWSWCIHASPHTTACSAVLIHRQAQTVVGSRHTRSLLRSWIRSRITRKSCLYSTCRRVVQKSFATWPVLVERRFEQLPHAVGSRRQLHQKGGGLDPHPSAPPVVLWCPPLFPVPSPSRQGGYRTERSKAKEREGCAILGGSTCGWCGPISDNVALRRKGCAASPTAFVLRPSPLRPYTDLWANVTVMKKAFVLVTNGNHDPASD